MINKKVAKVVKAAQISPGPPPVVRTKSNISRSLASNKSTDESKEKKLVKPQSNTAHKDEKVPKNKRTSVAQSKESAIVREGNKINPEKRSPATLQKQVSSSVKGPIKVNYAKRVPISNRSVLNQPNTSETKESMNKSKTSKTDAKYSGTRRATVPLRASHTVIVNNSSSATTMSPQNVMNQVHNVTVSSPPSIRRDLGKELYEPSAEPVEVVVTRDRTRTRTLEKSEVILLKPEDKSTTSMETPNPIRTESLNSASVAPEINIEIRQPISFEVHFDNENPKKISKSPPVGEEDTVQSYEDDFESYESDFEDDMSMSDANELLSQNTESDRNSLSVGNASSDIEDDSPIVKHLFNVHKVDDELDSGSFEMKPMSSAGASNSEHFEVRTQRQKAVDMQHDSGIEILPGVSIQYQLTVSSGGVGAGLSNILVMNNSNKTFDNISDIETETAVDSLDSLPPNGGGSGSRGGSKHKTAKLNRRGAQLLKKITLDTMHYVLYDCQPIPYDLFMKIYGSNDTAQASIQTHNTRIDQEIQLEPIELAEAWTQHPPTFYSRHMISNDFKDYKSGCSMRTCQIATIGYESDISECVNRLRNYTMPTRVNLNEIQMSAINYDHLNRFLLANEITISRLINDEAKSAHVQLYDSMIADSLGYFVVDFELRKFKVVRIFATPALPGFLLTLHQEIMGELDLIAVWNLANPRKPICLLSSWTPIECIEIHASSRNYVFAGLNDGSIAIWDYIEANYWHPLLAMNGTIKRFVPCQIVTPVVEKSAAPGIGDMGQIVAIRSLYLSIDVELLNGYNPKQLCSLHDSGFLVLWTVLETSTTNMNAALTDERIDHQSEWSSVKLIQNQLIDLRPHVQSAMHLCSLRPTSSSFDKTCSYFESNLFNDAALQELQFANQIETKRFTKFRCIALELTHDGILIATNENFILFGRKTMRSDTFQKLQIAIDDHNVRIDALLALNLTEDDVILAAQRDGTIKSFCYDRRVRRSDPMNDSGDEPSISSAYSLPPIPPCSKPTSAGQTSASSSISAAFTIGHDMGKSCTIQSIVQCERKLYDEVQALKNLDMNEYRTLFDEDDAERRSAKNPRFVNDQMVFNNALDHFARSRRQMVQLINSNQFAILHRRQLRLYDLRLNEISQNNSNINNETKFIEVTSTIGDNDAEYLILLDEKSGIQVHILTNSSNNNKN